MLLAGSTRFLFLGFCTGGGGRRTPTLPARNPRWAAITAGRISLVWLCKLPGTQNRGLGWGVVLDRAAGALRRARSTGLLPSRRSLRGPVSSGPLWSFPRAAQDTRHAHAASARRGLHQSCPMGARLRGTPAAAPARSWRGKGRTQTPHRPLQLGSCYSTAAHRVAARTFLTTPAQGWVFTPSAHCFTQATFKP